MGKERSEFAKNSCLDMNAVYLKNRPLINFDCPELLFERKHICLYPSLLTEGSNCYLSWYEYNSATKPSASQLYLSKKSQYGAWTSPEPLTSGEDYDNGPSLCLDGKNQLLLAWHSWRPPGRGPFIQNSMRNVWLMSVPLDVKSTGQPFLAFENLPQTSYPAIIRSERGRYIMSMTIEESKIGISKSVDGRQWSQPNILFEGMRSDLIEDAKGIFRLVFERDKFLYVSSSNDLVKWTKPILICHQQSVRPKISQIENHFYVLWHSDHWGKSQISQKLNHVGGKLKLKLKPGIHAGNHHWAISNIKINHQGMLLRDITFDSENVKKYFTGHVEVIERMFGDRLVHSSAPRILAMDLQKGEYEIVICMESWIASTREMKVAINGRDVEMRPTEPDQIYYNHSSDFDHWSPPIQITTGICDSNRPSKMMSSGNECFYVYNDFSGDRTLFRLHRGQLNHG